MASNGYIGSGSQLGNGEFVYGNPVKYVHSRYEPATVEIETKDK